ncbi:MAG: NAD(P)-binding domain-containing protein [Clostridia bacterium]|nr:NAD(P)-binding domain-containing protein [Clostridia bacterium]
MEKNLANVDVDTDMDINTDKDIARRSGSDEKCDAERHSERYGGRLCVVGGDLRQAYLAIMLEELGYGVSRYAVAKLDGDNLPDSELTIEAAVRGCSAVIMPFPLSPDGITLNCFGSEKPRLEDIFSVISGCALHPMPIFAGAVRKRSAEIAEAFGLRITDYGEMEEIALRNAVPTAEGAVEVAMKELDITIRGAKMAVLGYGRCGGELCRLLRAMGAEVVGVARSARDRAKMQNDGVKGYSFEAFSEVLRDADIIFNTVPCNVITCDILAELPVGSVIVELASAPGGVDRRCAAEYGVKVIHAASLPGKYAPRTAAGIICEALAPILERTMETVNGI